MQKRGLGSDLEDSALGLGCMGMSLGYGPAAVDLTADDLREIDSAAARLTAHGARYSESSQRMIDR